MKKILVILLLLFPMKSLGQNPKLDSLKLVVEQFFAQDISVERDSILTVSMYELNQSFSMTDNELRKLWTDSLNKFSKISKWRQTIAYSHSRNGVYYFRKGYSKLAFKETEMAVELFKKFGNEKLYAIAFFGLTGQINWDLRNRPIEDKATQEKYLRLLLDALELAKKQQNSIQIANQEDLLGTYFYNLKNYGEALNHYKNSTKITEKDPNSFGGRWQEGLCLLHLERQKEGFDLITQAKEACQKPRKDGLEKFVLTSIAISLGNYFIEKKAYGNALKEAKMGIEACKNLKISPFEHLLNKIFYQAYKNLGKPTEALSYFEKVQAYDQETQTKESLGQYLEWQLKYEDEKQKNQIQILENQQLTQTRNFLLLAGLFGLGIIGYVFWNNRKLKKKNEEIQKALLQGQTIERKRIASELHDNISNKILGVKMRVELLENEHFTAKERTNYEATLGFIDEVYSDIRLVSHNLLPEELEKEGLKIAIENLVRKLNLIEKTHFEVKIQTNQVRFSPRLEYEIYSIILELVNNILKHAEAKNAIISILEEEKQLKISVKDNGKGFDNQAISFNNLGLKNIHSRVESLRGNIEIENFEGANVKIEVPV